MTAVTVNTGSTTFANVSVKGLGIAEAGVMTYTTTTQYLTGTTVAFSFPKGGNGQSIIGAIPIVNGAVGALFATMIDAVVVASGTYTDTITLTIGDTLPSGSVIGVLAIYGV